LNGDDMMRKSAGNVTSPTNFSSLCCVVATVWNKSSSACNSEGISKYLRLLLGSIRNVAFIRFKANEGDVVSLSTYWNASARTKARDLLFDLTKATIFLEPHLSMSSLTSL